MMLTPFERGLVAHLVADWLFQNDWIARYKSSFRHPALWVHAGIHAVAMTIALGWQAGLVLAVFHLFVDTRHPLRWWQRVFRQTTDGPYAIHVAIWSDQVIHIASIAAWVVMVPPHP